MRRGRGIRETRTVQTSAGVPLVYADLNYARQQAEHDLHAPGRYYMTIGEPPRCAVFDVTVDEELRVTCTLTALGRLRVARVERVPVQDEERFRRAWDVLFGEIGP